MIERISARSKVLLASIVAVLLILGSATAGYATYFSNRGLLGVSVAGQSIARMTEQEVVDEIVTRADDTTVTLEVDGVTREASLGQLGVSVDAQATASEAFAQNSSVWSRIQGLFTKRDVAVVHSINAATLQKYTEEFTEKVGTAPVSADVSLNEDGNEFVVSEAQVGHGVDLSVLRSLADEAAQSLTNQHAELEKTEIVPAISTDEAQAVADDANGIVNLDIQIHTGSNTYSPSAADKANWITLDKSADSLGDVSIVDDNVISWVINLGASTNDDPVPGVRNVNSRGDVISTVSAGSPGWLVNNAESVAEGVLAAVKDGSSYSGTFEYDKIEQTFENRYIADGAENLAYSAAPGERWIDINLGNNTVTAYEGATPVHGPVSMVPGAPTTPTVTGSFKVWLKVASQTMSGYNPDGSRYRVDNVPWILYFHGDYALHGAPWRSSFGWSGPSGSHGCVNMPVGPMKAIYDWASVGTPVISHY
ncbi:MAG: L,D-transpeptidase family protein [Actinomycetaceae bacterium]|nr:L,D-transpeptidase family protein [Actinomycetaceae bacterium]